MVGNAYVVCQRSVDTEFKHNFFVFLLFVNNKLFITSDWLEIEEGNFPRISETPLKNHTVSANAGRFPHDIE